jgi:signal transduction histidine kinase
MLKSFWQKTIPLILVAIVTAIPAAGAEYAYRETRDLVALVEAAAAAVHDRGEAAFADFRVENSRWYKGNSYVFVWDLQGNRYVYPPDVEHERTNVLDLRDAGNKPIGRMIIAAAKNGNGRGWVHYQWNRPHELEPQWKSTYIVRVKAPSGQEYLIGSGIYQSRVEKAFIVQEVDAAAVLLQKEGKAAFAVLRDRKNRFYFHDTYVFVTAKDGTELVNPAFPGLEGRNIWDIQDIKGNYLVREYTGLALKEGSGWITYYWPKPDAPQSPVKKLTYVKKVMVDGKVMIVGAGMYE